MSTEPATIAPPLAVIKGEFLVISLPLNRQPVPSSTGKSLMVASSGGNKTTGVLIGGKPVIIGVNAYIKG